MKLLILLLLLQIFYIGLEAASTFRKQKSKLPESSEDTDSTTLADVSESNEHVNQTESSIEEDSAESSEFITPKPSRRIRQARRDVSDESAELESSGARKNRKSTLVAILKSTTPKPVRTTRFPDSSEEAGQLNVTEPIGNFNQSDSSSEQNSAESSDEIKTPPTRGKRHASSEESDESTESQSLETTRASNSTEQEETDESTEKPSKMPHELRKTSKRFSTTVSP